MNSPKRKSGLVNPFPVLQQIRGHDAAAAAMSESGAQKLDPASIRPSIWANRHESNFTGPDFEALKAEIKDAGGNVQPVKVRPVAGGGFELAFGHRRHRACAELGLPVLAIVQTLDDQTLFAEMDRENRGRKDLSPWEQGMMYRRALDQGLFPSNRQLAAAVGKEVSLVGKYLQIARLPDEVVQAFHSPTAIQVRWGKELAEALEKNRQRVLLAAQAVAGKSKDAATVFRVLTAVDDSKLAQGGVTVTPPPRRLDLGHGRHVDVRAKGERVTLELDAALIGPDGWAALEKAFRKVLRP